jgi:hypothetical protein
MHIVNQSFFSSLPGRIHAPIEAKPLPLATKIGRIYLPALALAVVAGVATTKEVWALLLR